MGAAQKAKRILGSLVAEAMEREGIEIVTKSEGDAVRKHLAERGTLEARIKELEAEAAKEKLAREKEEDALQKEIARLKALNESLCEQLDGEQDGWQEGVAGLRVVEEVAEETDGFAKAYELRFSNGQTRRYSVGTATFRGHVERYYVDVE